MEYEENIKNQTTNHEKDFTNDNILNLDSKNKFIKIIKNYKVKNINILNNTESEINKRIDKIYVINLTEDVHKRNYIITIMKKYGINFTLVIVERISREILFELGEYLPISINELGCCISHLWCLYQVICKKMKNVIIFEDDIIFHKDFENKFINIYDNNPNIDFLLLGAHDYNFSKFNYKNIKNKMYKPKSDNNNYNNLYGAHANLYSLKAAKRMFRIRTSQIDFFDKEYMLMFNYFPDSFICYPNLVLANISESKLQHEKDILSYSEKEYYKKCFINLKFNKYNFIYINLLKYIQNIYTSDNYETLTDRCLEEYCGKENTSIIKQRMVMDFFTINDIINILYS
jgi:GR25 family glycosyltransferase involved in LPS biosynthesis